PEDLMSDEPSLSDLSVRLRAIAILIEPCFDGEEQVRSASVFTLLEEWDCLYAVIKDDGLNFVKIRSFLTAIMFVRKQSRTNALALVTRLLVCKKQEKWDEDLQLLLTIMNENCRPFAVDYTTATTDPDK
ncbi:MAG: hypothetical protein NUV56_01045, partial [Candidatus Uhrbacteria bacterium]|nr:hypothetical protein [Candidatus Uhrbacteria bacterium]